MTTILLVRHGETDWNLHRRVQGHADTPLNDTGRAQARALGDELAGEPIDAVYSSDLMRAHETARLVAEPRGLDVTAIRDLRERHFGTWEGLTDEEIFARFPEAREGPWGDGETRDEMTDRVLGALRRIADSHPGSRVLVVSHGGPLRSVLTHCGIDGVGRIENCHVVRIEIVDGVLRRVD
ncbi:MAG TPA: histidine phosphatase family protein [Actinomycetota bacterium]|nr:histidine phosphatase family protein [Actinomycetota bacterium]